MKPAPAILLASLAVLSAPGCSAPALLGTGSVRPAEVPAERPVEGRPALGTPIPIAGSSTQLVPFGFARPKGFTDNFRLPGGLSLRKLLGRKLPWQGSQLAGPKPTRVAWQNVVFADPLADRADPLLAFRAVIVQAVIHETSGGRGRAGGLWAFTVVNADTNGDGLLGPGDTGSVLLSSAEGLWARRATPEGAGSFELVSIDDHPGTALVQLRLRRDADGDGRFTAADPVEPWVVDPASGAPAERVVPLETVQRLERVAR